MARKTGVIEFEATIPPIKSAILVDGQGGGQVKLEVPESDMPELVKLMALRGMVLRVTVAVD